MTDWGRFLVHSSLNKREARTNEQEFWRRQQQQQTSQTVETREEKKNSHFIKVSLSVESSGQQVRKRIFAWPSLAPFHYV